MAGEYWREIEAEAKRLATEQNNRREDITRSAQERLDQEIRSAEVLNIAKEEAIKKLHAIFEDVRRNEPEIRRAAISDVRRTDWDVLVLRWGSKFELTPSEKSFIERNKYWKETVTYRKSGLLSKAPDYSEDLAAGRAIPSTIIERDFYFIEAGPHQDVILTRPNYGSTNVMRFLEDQRDFLKKIPLMLGNPVQVNDSSSKYVDYWRDPRPRASTSYRSSDDCCCT